MKSYREFPDEFEYHTYLEKQDVKGRLPNTSVDDSIKAEMLAQLLNPNPAQGVYLEIGPAWHPYAIGTSRSAVNYLGIDGGEEYL